MANAGEFVVIGLGRFGSNVAMNLARFGQPVLAIDRNEERVRDLGLELVTVACTDATDEKALRELRVDRMSCAVVAIGAESMEASILSTALLRQLGVPRVLARSLNPLHARVLLAVGAHTVINPEREMGERVARQLAQPNILERIELSPRASLVEIGVPESFVGRTLAVLGIRQQYNVTVVAIRRDSEVVPVSDASMGLAAGDLLLVIGEPSAIERIAALV